VAPKRILLVRACDPREYVFSTCPPLGILYLAAYARKTGGHDVRILDMPLEGLGPEEALPRILAAEPDVLGISGTQFDLPAIRRLAVLVKAARPTQTIVVGGPATDGDPESVVADGNVDFAVIGEGEETFRHLLDELSGREDYASVPGLAWVPNGHPVRNAPRAPIEDLDALPFPAWDLLDLKKYFSGIRFQMIYERPEYMLLFTSRGCSWKCTFCHDIFGKTFRARSPENVLDEIALLRGTFGIREMLVVDDTFNLDRERAKAILRGIVERRLDVRLNFPCGIRGDIVDGETLDLMKRSGVYRLHYAIESGSPRLQKRMRKHARLDRLKEIIAETDARDILTQGFFLFGFPTETWDEMEETVDYALSTRLHTAQFMVVKAFPGTGLWHEAKTLGIPVEYDTADYAYVKSRRPLNGVPEDAMERFVRGAYRRFYLDPKRMARCVRLHPRKAQMLRLAWLFARRAVLPNGRPKLTKRRIL